MLELSSAVDRLWDEHVRIRGEISRKTTDPLTVWGQSPKAFPSGEGGAPRSGVTDEVPHVLTIREKDRIYDDLYLTEHQQNAGPYARLKAAMDYWCALWFWPIDQAEELPTRQEFLFDMYALLGVDIVNASAKKKQSIGQIGMFDDEFYDNMYSLFDTLRYNRGNPPGKDNKYGDAINWDCLLHEVPDREDLYFVSADKDYRSEIKDGRFNLFLLDEWERKKKSHIYYYDSLVSFFSDNLQGIQLSSELEKEGLIEQLHNSNCYSRTHSIIARLSSFSGWTENQVERLCDAALNNNQIYGIFYDTDICYFYKELVDGYKIENMPDNSIKKLIQQCFNIEQL